MKIALGIVIVAATMAAMPALGSPVELSDSKRGMTCEYYWAGGSFGWRHDGGDWIDANGVAQGDKPFAVQSLVTARGITPVQWDVTDIVKAWANGAPAKGELMLRKVSDDRASVNFLSRENKKEDARPVLTIEWADGSRSRLAPEADATMTCSSVSGHGYRPTLQVGYGSSAILVFPFEKKSSSPVRATLTVYSSRRFGPAFEVGVYQLNPPWTQKSPVQKGIAAKYPDDKGIEKDPDVIFATSFESSSWKQEWSVLSRGSNADIVGKREGNGFEPLLGDALKATVYAGKKFALDLRYNFADKIGHEPEEAYFRYYLRLGENWDPVVGGKLPGFAGTYNRAGWGLRVSDGTNGWSARGSYGSHRADPNAPTPVGFYVYHAQPTTRSGVTWGWNLGPTGMLERDRWYSIEQYVRLNDLGKPNGVLKAWIDGKLVFEKNDILFRKVPDLRIENVWMNVYHGGTDATDRDISLYIDNVVIARKYIGPIAGSQEMASK